MTNNVQTTDSTLPASPPVGSFKQSVPKRLRAAGIHLALSSVIFLVALYLILIHWFPGFHFGVDGGWQGVRIMAAVQFVLGPMLTLIIFNPFKSRKLIAFDLGCLGVTQLGALVWGFYAIHSQLPAAVTYFDGSFHSMTIEPLKIEKYPLTLLEELSDRKPALIYVAPPIDEDEKGRMGLMAALTSVAPHEDPYFFKAFPPNWATVKAKALDAEVAARNDPQFAEGLADFLARQGGQSGDYFYFPYTGRYGSCTLAFSVSGELLDAVSCRSSLEVPPG
jgi:hypothetical protein